MKDVPAHNQDWQASAEACDAALDRQDLDGARKHLRVAQSLCDGDELKLRLLEADILILDGATEAGEAQLCQAQWRYPQSPWPLFKLAQLKRDQSRFAAARMFAKQAAQAEDALSNPYLLGLLVDLALRDQDAGEALAHFATLRENAPEHPEIALLAPRLPALIPVLTADPVAHHEPLTQLEALIGPDTDLTPALFVAQRQLGLTQAAEATALSAIAAGFGTQDMFWLLFNRHLANTPPDTLLRFADQVAAGFAPGLGRQFRVESLLADGQFSQALSEARAATGTTPARARQIAVALFGLARPALALRYLRRAVTRWPQDQGLAALAFHRGFALGQIVLAQRVLDQAGFTPQQRETFGLMLASQAGDLAKGQAHFLALQDQDQVSLTERTLMAMLLFCHADLTKLDQIIETTGNPALAAGVPMHRAGRPGMHMLEMTLEAKTLAELEDPTDVKAWCRAQPGSTLAAIRLIDHAELCDPGPAQASATHAIYQYWPKAEVPAEIAARMQTWQDLPGFTYERLTHETARRFLRSEMGPKWLQAFDMCREEVEQADMLRTCLLVRRGGVWADAQAELYGDPSMLLPGAGQLVLGRELLGGTLETGTMAADAQHPVLIFAARQIRASLLQRSADIDWNKTGAGVLTRALGQFIAQKPEEEVRAALRLLPSERLARIVDLRRPLPRPAPQDAAPEGFWDRVAAAVSSGAEKGGQA